MVGNAPTIDVMLLNVQIGTMMEQPVQHLRRPACGCGDDGGMKRRVAIRDMAVEGDSRLRPLVRIDCAGRMSTAIKQDVMTVRTGRGPGQTGRAACRERAGKYV